MDLKKQLIEQIIKPEMAKMITSTEGHILKLYDQHMYADVRIQHPMGEGQHVLRKVPIQLGSGGLSQSGPFQGDKVMVSFKNNNILTPVVVGIIETNFQDNWEQTRFKHSRKGAVIPDKICDRSDWQYSGDLYESESAFDYLK